jgi:hypothetical protein
MVTDFNSTHYYFIRCRENNYYSGTITQSCREIKFYNNNSNTNISISTTCDSKIYKFIFQQKLKPNSSCEEGMETTFSIFSDNNFLFIEQSGCWESLKKISYTLTKNHCNGRTCYQLLTLDNTNDSIIFSPNILIALLSIILIMIFKN